MLDLEILAIFAIVLIHFIANFIILNCIYQDTLSEIENMQDVMEQLFNCAIVLLIGWIILLVNKILTTWNRES